MEEPGCLVLERREERGDRGDDHQSAELDIVTGQDDPPPEDVTDGEGVLGAYPVLVLHFHWHLMGLGPAPTGPLHQGSRAAILPKSPSFVKIRTLKLLAVAKTGYSKWGGFSERCAMLLDH